MRQFKKTSLSCRLNHQIAIKPPDKSNLLAGRAGLDFSGGAMKRLFIVFLFAFFPALERSAMAAGAYPGCAAPPSSFPKSFTATPTTFASILNAAAAGDVIRLNSGAYGAVSIANRKYEQFLTIEAGPGQTPVLSSLTVSGASHLVFSGLTVNANGPRSKSPNGILVKLASSNNIVFANNIVESTSGAYPWKSMGTVLNATIAPGDGVNASQDTCLALNNNQIRNVFNGIYVGGDQVVTDGQNYMVSGNTIDHFAGDGIDHSATNIVIAGNRITNGLDICGSKCIHNDAIQGWN